MVYHEWLYSNSSVTGSDASYLSISAASRFCTIAPLLSIPLYLGQTFKKRQKPQATLAT